MFDPKKIGFLFFIHESAKLQPGTPVTRPTWYSNTSRKAQLYLHFNRTLFPQDIYSNFILSQSKFITCGCVSSSLACLCTITPAHKHARPLKTQTDDPVISVANSSLFAFKYFMNIYEHIRMLLQFWFKPNCVLASGRQLTDFSSNNGKTE